MKNLVIGSAFNLNWEQCKVWVNSLNQSGFEGDKILVVFGHNDVLISKLQENDIKVALFPAITVDRNICVDRFMAYHAILSQAPKEYNWVIATDVTDVVFQRNPENFINAVSFNNSLICSSENVKYKDEAWGYNNMLLSFGRHVLNRVENESIYNAGVIAAKHNVMCELSLLIAELCNGRMQYVDGGGGPDQAAYNFILSLMTFGRNALFMRHDEGWACQCGTTMDMTKPHYSLVGIDPLPQFKDNFVKTSKGVDFHVVHQYNRNPELKKFFEEKFA